jgi:hypothetical protein
MATVRVRIAILTVRITLSVCPFNRMAHTANNCQSDEWLRSSPIGKKCSWKVKSSIKSIIPARDINI